MEYDKSTIQSGPLPEPAPHEKNSLEFRRGHVRVKGDGVSVDVLKQPMRLHYSGRTIMSRLMKAPMTERLCHWNKYGEDLVRSV